MSRGRRTTGVEVIGYLSAAVGVGEAARRYASALRAVGVAVRERDVPLPDRDRVCSTGASDGARSDVKVSVNLVCLNPEQLVAYIQGPEAPPTAGRRTVGVWSWETDVVPTGWREAAKALAEVWTYSPFSAALISAGIGTQVYSVPPPIAVPSRVAATSLDYSPDGFRVLVMFDFLSTLERKNPLGAIAAFCGAFAPGDGAALILKSVNGWHRPERRTELIEAIGGRPDIRLVDRTMTPLERDALIASCDCLLSVHRSEGHGLHLAETMAAGKPVIATAFGGNTQFMHDMNSYLVSWRPTYVGQGVEHYPANATWAEPDISAASRLLREVRDDPAEARRRGSRARDDVLAILAPQAVGSSMVERLEAQHAGWPAQNSRFGSVEREDRARFRHAWRRRARNGERPPPGS